MRRFLFWMVSGALSGVVIATLVAPWALETLLSSPGTRDALCRCTDLITDTAARLIRTQLYGAGAGAVMAPLGAWLARRLWGRHHDTTGTTMPPMGASPSGGH